MPRARTCRGCARTPCAPCAPRCARSGPGRARPRRRRGRSRARRAPALGAASGSLGRCGASAGGLLAGCSASAPPRAPRRSALGRRAPRLAASLGLGLASRGLLGRRGSSATPWPCASAAALGRRLLRPSGSLGPPAVPAARRRPAAPRSAMTVSLRGRPRPRAPGRAGPVAAPARSLGGAGRPRRRSCLVVGAHRTLPDPAWPRKTRVGANSPSLWPTIDSLTNTGTCLRPSWTAIVWPDHLGEDRRGARPGPEHLLVVGGVHRLDAGHQALFDPRALLARAAHRCLPFPRRRPRTM